MESDDYTEFCRKARSALIRQSRAGRFIRSYSVRCADCGKTFRTRFSGDEDDALEELEKKLLHCPECNRWLCRDCMTVLYKTGGDLVCKECAEKRGEPAISVREYERQIRRTVNHERAQRNRAELARYLQSMKEETT